MKLFIAACFLTFSLTIKAATLCNGTDTINCKVILPKFSEVKFDIEVINFSYDSFFYVYKSQEDNLSLHKEKALEKVLSDASLDFEKLNRDKSTYKKVDCIIDFYKETSKKFITAEMMAKDPNNRNVYGPGFSQEDYTAYDFHSKVKCSVYNYVPLDKSEIKNHQCIEAQKCLSEATTIVELKKLETFRNSLCGTSDSVQVVGDGSRKGKGSTTDKKPNFASSPAATTSK